MRSYEFAMMTFVNMNSPALDDFLPTQPRGSRLNLFWKEKERFRNETQALSTCREGIHRILHSTRLSRKPPMLREFRFFGAGSSSSARVHRKNVALSFAPPNPKLH